LDAIGRGASEIDMVINIGRFKSKEYDYVENEIKAIVRAIDGKALLKVIVETCLLEDWEIEKACESCKGFRSKFHQNLHRIFEGRCNSASYRTHERGFLGIPLG
jgi:deoxyribose-phosphate aldolase